jgi:hypothetical protein
MSTGLTFGTITSLYGLSAHIIDLTQFSLLIAVVVLSAIVPTAIAQRFYSPTSEEQRDLTAPVAPLASGALSRKAKPDLRQNSRGRPSSHQNTLRVHAREYESEYECVSATPSSLQLAASAKHIRCSTFPFAAPCLSRSTRTLNPKVAGSIPARPI